MIASKVANTVIHPGVLTVVAQARIADLWLPSVTSEASKPTKSLLVLIGIWGRNLKHYLARIVLGGRMPY